ncbi:MAG: plasmid replication protein RepC [Phyllobacterium sp.]
MKRIFTTTPFGRRPMSHAMMKAQESVRQCQAGETVDKWKLFRDITEARPTLAISDRALAVLHALLSFHKPAELEQGSRLVVFPSNRELLLRANGMSAVTLRRHLASLVDAGLVIRRDSPNGKRYARRDGEGEITSAFGFDLSPLVARAGEFRQRAEDIRTAQAERRLQHERISLHRRDLSKLVAFSLSGKDGTNPNGASEQADWQVFEARLAPLLTTLLRRLGQGELDMLEADLAQLRLDVEKSLKMNDFSNDLNACDDQNERQIKSQNPESLLNPFIKGKENIELEVERASPIANLGETARETFALPVSADSAGDQEPVNEPDYEIRPDILPPARRSVPAVFPQVSVRRREATGAKASAKDGDPGFTLGLVLRACPDIVGYAKGGIANWRDLMATSRLVGTMLGISADAQRAAERIMGEVQASIVLCTLLQRAEAIANPGGYLRSLTDKAREGAFSLAPILMSLLKARRLAGTNAGMTS